MKEIQIEAYGNPTEVLKVVDLPDVGAPAAGEVVIEVEASPINQYDLLLIAGGYGYRPRLPAVMGGATNSGSVSAPCRATINFSAWVPRVV